MRKKRQKVDDIEDRDIIDQKILKLEQKINALYEHRRKLSLIGFKSPRDYR